MPAAPISIEEWLRGLGWSQHTDEEGGRYWGIEIGRGDEAGIVALNQEDFPDIVRQLRARTLYEGNLANVTAFLTGQDVPRWIPRVPRSQMPTWEAWLAGREWQYFDLAGLAIPYTGTRVGSTAHRPRGGTDAADLYRTTYFTHPRRHRDIFSYAPIIIGGAVAAGAALGALGAEAGAVAAPTTAAGAAGAAAAPVAVAGAGIGAVEAAGVGATAATLFETVTDNIDTLGAVAEVAETGATTSLVGSILAIVQQLRDTVKPIVDTVAGAVRTVRDVVVAINDGILKPILEPITQTVKIVSGLITTIERLQREGIQGILRIPQAIADAFVSLDATMQRAVAMFGQQYLEALETRLIPGLAGAGAAPLGQLSAVLRATWPAVGGPWTPPRQFDPAQPIDEALYQKEVEEFFKRLALDETLVGAIARWLWDLSRWVPYGLAQLIPFYTRTEEFVRATAAIKRFDEGTALRLYAANIISRDAVIADLRALGYSEERAAALIEAIRKIPGDTQATEWFYRGLIDEAGLKSILEVNNWSAEDIERVIAAARRIPSPGDIIAGWLRGMISEADADRALAAHGYDETWAAMLKETARSPQSLGAAIHRTGRSLLISGLSLGEENLLVTPDALVEVGRAAGLSNDAIHSEWSLHWQLLSAPQAVEAYFRGWLTEAQIEQFLDAWSIPRSLQRNYIDLQRPRIPPRSVTSLVNRGVIGYVEARDILRSHGFTDPDINWLLTLDAPEKKTTSKEDADSFAGLTQSTVIALYRAGTLAREETARLLATLGYGTDAAESILDLTDLQLAAAERAAEVDLIVAQVKAGVLDFSDATALLSSMGATATETNKALARIAAALKDTTRLPSEGTILDLYKYGLLERTATADALGLIGYSAGWAELIIQLKEAKGG